MFTTKARVPYIEDGQDPWIKDPEVAAAARELHEAAAQFDNVLADFNARCAVPASAEPDAEGPTCDKDIGDEVVSKEMRLKQEAKSLQHLLAHTTNHLTAMPAIARGSSQRQH